MCAKFNEYNHPKPAAFFARLDTIQTLLKTDCNFSVKSVDKFLVSEYNYVYDFGNMWGGIV